MKAINQQRQPAERNNNIWMGNYRFKLSDMIPNSWFYKLKDMSTTKRNHKKSHHFTGELTAPVEPPRKSTKGKPRRRASTVATTAISAATRSSPRLVATSSSGCRCASIDSVTAGPPLPPPSDKDTNAIFIFEKPARKINGSDEEMESVAHIDLPPIITTSSSTDAADGPTCPSVTVSKKDKSIAKEPRSSPSRRFPVNSPGPKFRIMNSPRVSSKRFGQLGRRKSVPAAAAKRSLTDSLAILKSTNDPQREFRESMVEMIVENKISGSNELEDLLACYLSLNSDEYHDIIIKVFKQIWFNMSDIGIA